MADDAPRAKRFVSTSVEVEGRVEHKVVELPDFEPAPWGTDAELSIVGSRVPRVDALEKVTGRARFTADVQRPGMLFAALVRSPITRGTVMSIDLSPALAVSGVLDALVGSDLPRRIRVGGVSLFDLSISYPGQPVAAVCAETREAAERGAAAVAISCEEAPFALTFEDSTAPDAPAVRSSGNVARNSPSLVQRGDIEAGLRAAEVLVTREYRTPCVLHSAMEPHGAVAEWDGDRLTVWESTQGIFRVRDEVATALGLQRSHVRVIKEYMGGGFGAKNNAGTHTYVAALFAQRTGRPVRCVLDREGEQTDTGHRPSTRQRITLGAAGDGRLTAIDSISEIPLGIGGWEGGPSAMHREMYSCPHVRTLETFVYVNTQGMQAFRAPGHVEGAFALERAMDVLARELGMDPLELRIRNFAARDEEKDRPYSGNELLRCYAEGSARFGWATREERRWVRTKSRFGDSAGNETMTRGDEARANFPAGGGPHTIRRGFGLAAQVWGAGGGPPSYATVRLNSDGTADVLSGTQDLGTGSRTVLAQIAAESLGAKFEDVRVVLGDTERTPYAGNSWGSMTTASVGPAVRTAAIDAQRKLLEAASQLLECHPDDLVARDSTIVTKDGARRLAFAEVTKKLGNVMIMGNGSRGPNPQGVGLMSFGAQFAEVEVDTETGVVRVVRIVAAHDAGRIINPLLAESQLEGGILQGLGYALFEERVLDRATGRPLNPSLHDYKIPTFADTPVIEAFCVQSVDTVANHVGARGLAEPPIIPTAPAIANAVADALGVEIDEIPMTPWRVLTAGKGEGGRGKRV